jgi:hypothetical protein
VGKKKLELVPFQRSGGFQRSRGSCVLEPPQDVANGFEMFLAMQIGWKNSSD